MAKDFVKRVAQVYAEGDAAKLSEVADEVLHEIEIERAQLGNQAAAIRQLVAAKPRPRATVIRAVQTGDGRQKITLVLGRLSDDLKDRIRSIWQETMDRTGKDMTAFEVIQALERDGVSFPVANPVASVGTVIGPLRKAAEGDGQG
jgi:hypothetical protein